MHKLHLRCMYIKRFKGGRVLCVKLPTHINTWRTCNTLSPGTALGSRHMHCVCMCIHVCVCVYVCVSVSECNILNAQRHKYIYTYWRSSKVLFLCLASLAMSMAAIHTAELMVARGWRRSFTKSFRNCVRVWVFVCVCVCVCVCACVCVWLNCALKKHIGQLWACADMEEHHYNANWTSLEVILKYKL